MSKNQLIYPKARTEGVVSTNVGDETIVYDTAVNKAYCLSKLAKTVWEHCDGSSDISAILALVKKSSGQDDATLTMVHMAMEELEQTNLLENSVDLDDTEQRIHSRRKMLETIGKFAASLPLITAVTIQPAIAAISQSCGGISCRKNSDCPGHNFPPPCDTKCIGGICVPKGSNCSECP